MKRTAEWERPSIDRFSRPFHGLRSENYLCSPAMNRWAIINRPLRGRGAGVQELRPARKMRMSLSQRNSV